MEPRDTEAGAGTNTKARILEKALELFSAQGYDAVSVGDIAKAVGIKAPSLYNHYPSKRAIFDAIVEETAAQYERDTGRIDIHVQDSARDVPVFTAITADAQRDHQPLSPDDDHRAVPLAGACGAVHPALC